MQVHFDTYIILYVMFSVLCWGREEKWDSMLYLTHHPGTGNAEASRSRRQQRYNRQY